MYVFVCICIYNVYTCMYVWGEFIRACISTYMHVFACICLYLRKCLYLNPLQTAIGWSAYKHVFVCIGMYTYIAPHKSVPSCCTCPLRIPLSTSFRCHTSSAACPWSQRGISARFPATCPVAETPAIPGARAIREGRRDRAASCSTSTRGPWFGPRTTRLAGVEAINELIWTVFKRVIQVDTVIYRHIQIYTDIYIQIHALWFVVKIQYKHIYTHISTYMQYAHIQTVIFVHILCYIRAYFLLYSCIYAHIAHMCA